MKRKLEIRKIIGVVLVGLTFFLISAITSQVHAACYWIEDTENRDNYTACVGATGTTKCNFGGTGFYDVCCTAGQTCPAKTDATRPNIVGKDFGPIAKISDLESVFENVISYALGLVGIVLFILLLIGGFKYITAGGDPKAAEGAKKTITYAIGGLLLILASYLILVLIKNITGVDVTQFQIIQL